MPGIPRNRLPTVYYLFKHNISQRIHRFFSYLTPENPLLNELMHSGSDCIFIFDSDCASRRYRVNHSQQNLESLNLTSRMLSYQNLKSLKHFKFLRSVKLVILHRLPMTVTLKAFLSACRKASIKVILDLDDAIHDPNIYRQSAVFDLLNPLEKKLHLNMSERIRNTLAICDSVTVSTQTLADQIIFRKKPVFVIPNRVSSNMLNALSPSIDETPYQTLGFMSGSETHHRDLNSISESLHTVFQEFPSMKLILAGPVPLPDQLRNFSDRIQYLPFKSWPEHLNYYRKVNLVICPLEAENPFCMAKSGVKYLEAGLSSVPCIATPTSDFRRLISDGKTGFLAQSLSEWTQKLRYCLTHTEAVKEVGQRAHDSILEFEMLEHNIPVWKDCLNELEVLA